MPKTEPDGIMLKFFLKPEPTLIESGYGRKIVAYVNPSPERGACLQFYDLESRKTFAEIRHAEVLIDCYTVSSSRIKMHSTQIVYLEGEYIHDVTVDFKKLLETAKLSREDQLQEV